MLKTGSDGKDVLEGTKGQDTLTGGGDQDVFVFRWGFGSSDGTLTDGDRITDYEFGEEILIEGVEGTVKAELEYDQANDRTELRLDFDGNGITDRTIYLDGDRSGQLQIDKNCCGVPTITLKIKEGGSGIEINGSKDGDFLAGSAGIDTIFAGAGDDYIAADSGADFAFGGHGNDVLLGGDGDDHLFGSAGNDEIVGGAGNDVLGGGDGEDTVFGGAGQDVIYGGRGADKLFGGDGADILWGGAGDDELRGGAGAERFSFVGGSGNDQVFGFNHAEGDLLDLQGQTFTQSTNGDGDIVLTLAGGGVITLEGVTSFSSDFIA